MHSPLLRLALAAVLLVGIPPAGAQEAGAPSPDPFYTSLLQDGIQAYDEDDPAEAARLLRLACFGLLELPPLLADCLARLGLAQAAVEDREGFTESFRRLSTVEKRFSGYARAALPTAVREAFEQRLVRWVRAEELAEVPVFAELADRQRAAGLARLPVRQRRKELTALAEAEPGKVLWRLLLAEADIEEKDFGAAAGRIERALEITPGDAYASCLMGLTRARQQACGPALASLEQCPFLASDLRYAEAALGCQVDLGQWQEAETLLAELPKTIRSERSITRLAREFERRQPASPAAGTARTEGQSTEGQRAEGQSLPDPVLPPLESKASTNGADAGERPAPDGDPARPAQAARDAAKPAATAAPAARQAPPALSDEEKALLQRVRQSLNDARYAGELEEPLRLAREVADAHPDSTEAQHLAAQIAYRASNWRQAADYFRRGGDPGDGQPLLLFYMAVSFYEVGEAEGAARALRRALPGLERTPYVDRYVERILGTEPAALPPPDGRP